MWAIALSILGLSVSTAIAGNTLVYWQPNTEAAMNGEGELLKFAVQHYPEVFGVAPEHRTFLPINAPLPNFVTAVDQAFATAGAGDQVFLDITSHGNKGVVSTATELGKIPLATIARAIGSALERYPDRKVNVIYNACSSGTLIAAIEQESWGKGGKEDVNLLMATSETGDTYKGKLHGALLSAAGDLRRAERVGKLNCPECTPFQKTMRLISAIRYEDHDPRIWSSKRELTAPWTLS